MNQPFVSPGTWQLHPLPLFDFQLNRLVMWNHGDPEQIKKNAGRITDFKSWAQVLKALSAQAESEKQWACAAGYEVLAFEGPGQGAALRRYGLTFTDQWEKPVKAVLDYYNAGQVTIIGVSLGGELCLRAAAMESRITGAVSWCVLPGIYDALMADKPPALRAKLEQLLEENRREEILELYRGLAEQEPLFRWSISHSNYAYGTSDVYEYLQKIRAFSIRLIADQIQQDVLLISTRKDMLVDFFLYRDEIDLLSNARSLTFYVPGAPLFGEAHCNMGNPQLIMDTILTWQGSRKHR